MLNHFFYKGLNTYDRKKKNIFLIVRKQPGEIDWILPALNNIKNKVNIITIFEKEVAIKLLKQNEILYKIFLETTCCYIVNSKYKCFVLRLALKISNILNLKKAKIIFKEKIFENYYNIEEVLKNLCSKNIIINKKNILLGMQDFTDNSPWILKLKNEIKDLKVISYPHTTKIFSTKKNFSKFKKKKFNNNYFFLSSKNDLSHFNKKISNQSLFICGYPKYEKKWLKKINKNSNRNTNFSSKGKRNIFISYKGFDNKKYIKTNYIKQVQNLFEFAKDTKKYKLIFKFHPNAQEDKVFLKIANNYSKEIWYITKDHLHTAIQNSFACMSFYNNASLLDFLASGKVPIQLENITFNKNLKSNYTDLKLCLTLRNNLNIQQAIDLSAKKRRDSTLKNMFDRFDKNFRKINSIKFTSSKILEIMR